MLDPEDKDDLDNREYEDFPQVTRLLLSDLVLHPWNNGKSGATLDLTSEVQPHPDCKYTCSTTPGLQIRVIGCCVAVPHYHWSAVPTPWFIYISQLSRDSFSVSQQPPIWEPPSHYSMLESLNLIQSCFKCLKI